VTRSFLGYALVASVLVAPAALAQDRQSLTEQLKTALSLTDDQVTKVKAIEEQMRSDMQKARDDSQGDRQAARDKMQKINEKMRTDVKALLTDDQKTKFDAWAKEQDARRQQGRQGGQGRGGQDQGPPVNGKPDKQINLGKGGFDYLTADAASRKLYVSHSTQVEVIDMDKDEKIATIEGVDGSHGVAIAAEAKHGFATAGKAQKFVAFDLETNKVLKSIDTGAGPDGCLFVSSVNEAWSINHKGGNLTCVDAKSLEVTKTVEIGGTLESGAEVGDKVFINIEDKDQIAAVDAKKHELVTKYSVAPGTGPAGLASDPKTGLLFIGCRNKKLVVMEAATGKVVTSFDIGQGCDAVAFDSDARKVYASCGDGHTFVFGYKESNTLEALKTIDTARGGKCCAVDSKTHKLYVTVAGGRRDPSAESKIYVFNTETKKVESKD
jgi:DNA-binding beta-propeller fold protein YncE